MDMSLSKLWEMVKDREEWRTACSPRGCKESEANEQQLDKLNISFLSLLPSESFLSSRACNSHMKSLNWSRP